MNRRRSSVSRLLRLGTLLVVLMAVSGAGTPRPARASTTIVVPRDFPTIQAAVNAAPPGSTIQVLKGTYNREIVIAKDLTLSGHWG